MSKRAQAFNKKQGISLEVQSGDTINPKSLTTIVSPTHNPQNNNQLRARKSPPSVGEKRDPNDGPSSDDESVDFSEKANRIEGAGGNNFHYFCRICKFYIGELRELSK